MRPVLFCVFLVACATDPSPDSSGRASAERAVDAPTDGVIARRTPSPDGRWEARVADGGDLSLVDLQGRSWPIARDVGREVAFSPDGRRLVYSQWGEIDSDLWVVDVEERAPRPLAAGPNAQDRPVFAPGGDRVAYVSGATGIASVWVTDGETDHQLTNVGLEDLPRQPGRAPEGFVPPPDGTRFEWTARGLAWAADGQLWEVTP